MNKNNHLHFHSNRRRLLTASAVWPALAWMSAVRAQTKPPVVIGWLDPGSRALSMHLLSAFKEGMAAHGWKEGAQYVLEERWLDNRLDQLPAMAQELAAKKPSVIVGQPSSIAAAAAKAAPNTPIVQTGGTPVEGGNVSSLARPGGMITGLSSLSASLSEKALELLCEAMPKVKRVGFLVDPRARSLPTTLEHVRGAIKRFGLDARFAEVNGPEQLEPVISRLVKERVQALHVLPSSWFGGARLIIIKHAGAHRLPVVGTDAFAEVGGLLGYGANRVDLCRRAAYFVDRILKGAKPHELPVEQPTRFDMVVNLKTAKALGITLPPTVMVRATKVIE